MSSITIVPGSKVRREDRWLGWYPVKSLADVEWIMAVARTRDPTVCDTPTDRTIIPKAVMRQLELTAISSRIHVLQSAITTSVERHCKDSVCVPALVIVSCTVEDVFGEEALRVSASIKNNSVIIGRGTYMVSLL